MTRNLGLTPALLTLASAFASDTLTSVVTYHNDPQRTGWNHAEHVLTPANVRPGSFEFYTSVPLDDQVDTQPLVVANVSINGQVLREVVYVATEGNTVYAIAPGSVNNFPLRPTRATILRSRNLGPPVTSTPCGLGNVGITSTPTIDVQSQTLFVVAYTQVGGKPTYHLHALDLGTLNDKPGSPVTVAASHKLTDGSVVNFDATVQRQRPALLLSAGNVYAAFGSFCDLMAQFSRGWLLGWNAARLAPMAANELTNTRRNLASGVCSVFPPLSCQLVPSAIPGRSLRTGLIPTGCPEGVACSPIYLSSIWMSGYGVAAEHDGDLFFVTGNSDGVNKTYTGTTNIQESVVKMRSDLSAVMDLFTPSNVSDLDNSDIDFGAGGVMVVPDQPGPVPKLAVAAGKDCRLFILDRGSLGGFHTTDLSMSVDIGGALTNEKGCWCGPSYYKGSDGVGRVVSSGTYTAMSWTIDTAASPALQLEASAPSLPIGPQDGGFFTSISSDGISPNTAIIWAIGRPSGTDNHITLYAFNGTASGGTLPQLWSRPAGAWSGGNANAVPTVVNGRVYVPSYKRLAIASLTGRPPGGNNLAAPNILGTPPAAPRLRISGTVYWGTIQSVEGSRVTIALRTGKLLQADLSEGAKNGNVVKPRAGLHVFINGVAGANGVLNARTMWRAKGPGSWGADRPR